MQQKSLMGGVVRHFEHHRLLRLTWLRAAVLGANDGITSTTSLLIGVISAHATHEMVLLTGLAGLVAGSLSMASGEYVSVSSQADTEQADLALERMELATDPEGELQELTQIYVSRGLRLDLAQTVAHALTEHDALQAHARDELGITQISQASPMQAAMASALGFALGAGLPLLSAWCLPSVPILAGTALIFLAILGGMAARMGGAKVAIGILRVTLWGAFAMMVSAGIGHWFGVALT